MQDDFVPEVHLGLWKEEGRAAWAAFLTRWPPAGYLSKKSPQETTYSVRLDRGAYNSAGKFGKFLWSPTYDPSGYFPTPEDARREAVATIDEMIANLRVIAAGLSGDPDTDDGEAP